MYRSDYRRRTEAAIAHYTWPYTIRDIEFHKSYREGEFKPRKIVSVIDLLDALEKRATTETELRDLFCKICLILEPPSCIKGHCEHHTVYAFCNCSVGRVPGKCKEHLLFIKRRKEREEARLNNKEEKQANAQQVQP